MASKKVNTKGPTSSEVWPRWVEVDDIETARINEDGIIRYSILREEDEETRPLPTCRLKQHVVAGEPAMVGRFISVRKAREFAERMESDGVASLNNQVASHRGRMLLKPIDY